MYCIRCGKRLCDDANFCHNCGAPVNKIYKDANEEMLKKLLAEMPEEMKVIDEYVNSLFDDREDKETKDYQKKNKVKKK